MKREKEYIPSEMGKEIIELEKKYHEYYELRRQFNWLYRTFEKVVIIVLTICGMDILYRIMDFLEWEGK